MGSVFAVSFWETSLETGQPGEEHVPQVTRTRFLVPTSSKTSRIADLIPKKLD